MGAGIKGLRRAAVNDYVAWFEGVCEPVNPGGTAPLGAIVKDEEGTVLLAEGRVVGKGEGMLNNVAEYAAIIRFFEYTSPNAFDP